MDHNFTGKLHHACLLFRSVHQMAPLLSEMEDIWWGLDTLLSTPKGWKAELAWWTIYWILEVTPNIWGPALLFRFMFTQVEPKLVKVCKGYFVKLVNLCWNRITVVTFNCPWKLPDWNFLIFFGSPINRGKWLANRADSWNRSYRRLHAAIRY